MSANNDVMLVDRAWAVDEVKKFRRQWRRATGGNMEAVTVDLNLLFGDIIRIISHLGDDPVPDCGEDRQKLQVK